MLEGIRRKKITLLFLILDADQNGYVEHDDFVRVASLLAQGVKSERASAFEAQFTRIFDTLYSFMDDNQDRRIALEEWVTYFERILADEQRYAELIEPMARVIFSLLDHNDDGKIALEEFKAFVIAYRIESIDAAALFAKLDTNANGYLTRDEFGYMITDFFLSDDPTKAGNYIFGDFE